LKRWTGLQILAVRNSSDISVEDHSPSLWRGIAIALLGAVLLAGCQESSIPKQLKPVP
jgi:hypothetical protein